VKLIFGICRRGRLLLLLAALSAPLVAQDFTFDFPFEFFPGRVGEPYTIHFGEGLDQLQFDPGVTFTYSFALTQGTLPPGLRIARNGLYDGVPTTPGTYNFTIRYLFTVTVDGASFTYQLNIIGTHSIEPGAGSARTISSSQMSFSFGERAAAQTNSLTVTNRAAQAQTVNATAVASSGGGWLSVAPASANLAAFGAVSFGVTATPGSLPPGIYSGTVTLSLTPSNDRFDVTVLMSIAAGGQVLSLSQSGLSFRSIVSGSAPPPQSFQVFNTGSGNLNWTATASTLSGGSGWLAISAASGTSSSNASPTVTVTVNPQGLAAGDYYGQIQVSAAGVANSPQTITVALIVLAPDQTPGPTVTPTGFVFLTAPGALQPPDQTAQLFTPTSTPLAFQASVLVDTQQNWLSVQPAGGTIQPPQAARVTIRANASGLAPGVYRGEVNFRFADNSVRRADVVLVVPRANTTASGARAIDNCTPTRLNAVFTLLGSQFRVTAGWPAPIETIVVDDCANLLQNGSAIASFSNGDAPVVLAPARDGRWVGTWTGRNASPQLVVTVHAQSTSPRLEGSAQVGGTLQANPVVPIVGSGGAVSAASYRGPFAPGSLIAIFGSNLAETLAESPRLPWETELAGARVVLGGRVLPLQFASNGQINAMVPYDLPANTTQQLIVRKGVRLSSPEAVTVASAQPSVFTKDRSGEGPGIVSAVRTDGTYVLLVDPQNPVRAGDVLIVYCEGLGPTNPPVPAGAMVPSDRLYEAANPVTATVGGQPAQVLFAGLVSGFTGLYQVNIVVPAGVPPGDDVPATLTSAGLTSRAVTIAVR
jgi:uncharacterized protein (TIGR03437 family)